MAKSLLLNVLCDVLGNYVEGLSRENLKVAVWSGTIDLSNLKLKGTALDNLNLPIKVERGYLKKLHLKIPWASLESKPVIVELDGIYLQASPLDMANLSAEDAQRMVNAANMKKLLEAENGIITMVQKKENIQDTAKKATYVQQLTAKIIDNLEVLITNLHVRYEDSTSIPGSVFSCGFTIEKLCLTTTDETWTSRFVSRDINTRKETAIHKLGTMENFGVYWNKSSTQLGILRYDEWEAHMYARIFHSPPSDGDSSTSPRSPSSKRYVTSPTQAESMSYLLAPPNIFSMKVAHREICTETHPKLDVIMDSTLIPFAIQSDQYQQLKLVSQEFKDMDRRRLLITHRPQLRPTSAPREWWFYAYSLITGRNLNNGKGKLQLLSECVRAKRVYVPYQREKLVRREIIEPLLVGNEGEQQQYASTHATVEAEMQKYRDTLPLATLLAFHEIAAKEAVVEILKLRGDAALMKSYIEKNAPAGKTKSTGETRSFWGGSTTKAASTVPAGSSPREPAKSSGGMFTSWFGKSKAKTPPPVPTAGSPTKVVASAAAAVPPPDNLSGAELEEDEQSMQNLEATLAKFSQEAAAAADDLFTLRVRVVTSSAISIILRKQPVAYMDMSMRSKVEMRRGNICVLFEVDQLSIQDSISERPIHTHLLSMIDAEQGSLDGGMEESSFQVPRIDMTDSITSPITVSSPKFCLAFESNTNGQSTLKIRSCPVQIVLNEPCVRGLMTCFASPVSKYTAGAPLLLTSMNAISSRIALPEKAGIQIDMEIYAPTIIIPEEFDADTGCMQLDTGKLIVHGSIVPGEMNWDVVVRAVNISMPRDSGSSSGKDRRLLEIMKAGTAEDHYLITPFDVKVKVRMCAEEESDIVIAVAIAPYIEGQLDALKLVRLKYIIDLIVRSMQPLPVSEDEESEAGSMRTPRQQLERDIYESDVPNTISAAKPLAIPSSSGSDIDYKRVKMTLQVALPRLAMVLSIASDHTAELTVSAIDLTVIKRAGDMNVQISAEGMALTDSQRPPNHRAILWTVQEDELKASTTGTQPTTAVPLLKVAYRSLNTPLSPLYNGNQTELSIACNTLQCGVDDVATMRYVPFAASFMEHYQKYYGTVTADEAAASAITARRQQQQPPAVLPFGGTLIVFSVSRISLDILHCPEGNNKKTDATTPSAGEGVCLESAFSTEVREIFVQYATNQTSNEVTAFIGAVDVKDVRTSSQAFVYNTLFTRSALESSMTTTTDNHNNNNTPLSEYSDKIISVKYTKQLDTLQSCVEVFLQDITSYVSVDIIMAFVELILANINSMNAILAAINGQQDITEIVMRRIKQLQTAAAASGSSYNPSLTTLTQTNIDEIYESMDVTVTVLNPRLLLLEDPSNSSSKAIVSDCYIHFHLSQSKLTAKKAKRFEVTDTFHCALQKAQVFVVSDVSTNANPHKIIAPTGLDVHVKRHSENGVMLTTSLNVGSEPITCRVSLNDIVLTNSIIGRAKLTKRQGKRDDAIVVDATNKPRTSAPTQQLTLLTVQLNFSTVSVVLLNDYHQVNIPMFRVALDQLAYSSNGAIGMMQGEGSMLLNADFYNSTVALWEPVLEPWVPTIKVRRDTEGTEVSLNSRGVLQVNVSGAMCNGIYTCLALLSKIGQEGVAGERVKVHPWVVRNHLGTPLELFDSRANESLGVLMDDQMFVIPPKKADPKVRKQGSYRVDSYPDLFELRLVDGSIGERVPITQIPTRTVRSRLYHFLPVHTGPPKAKKNLQSEPITEEVFENQRYYPMKFSWGEPWSQMGDPSKWTDSRGQTASDPAGCRLPGGWEWVDPSWKVEVGKVGVETDGDGWFYSPAFSAFTASRKQRRAQQPLDVVRRRRLTRTRAQPRNTSAVPSQDSPTDRSGTGEDHGPIPLYWDVVAKSDEASEIHITSGMVFHNNAPCAVEVQLLDALSSGSSSSFSVEANGILHLPYSIVHCNSLRVRPLNLDFTWSDKIACKLKSDETTPQLHSTTAAICTKPNFGAYNMIVHVLQRDKRITMTCAGCAQFYNLLPCKLSVLLSLRDSGLDTAVLEPGVAFGVTRVPMEAHTEVTFAIGEFASVHPVRVSQLRAAREVVVWLHNRDNVISGDTEPDLLSITLTTTTTPEGVLEIRAFSQYLLVDQSDTALLVRSDTSELTAPATSHAGAATDFVVRRSYQHERKYTRKPIVEQIMAMEDISMESCWVEGVGGVTMFQAGGENKISLGVSRGQGLLRDVSLDGLTAEKTPVEVVDPESQTAYNLALTLCPMPGPLSATRLLRVIPAYTIVNYLDEAVDLLHPTDKSGDHKEGFRVDAKSARTWHRPTSQPGTAMRLRSSSTAPSLGMIDVNELGASLLLLPRNDADAAKRSSFIVAHVEVKFSDPSEASYITVVIWRAKVRKISQNAVDNSTAMLSVKNETGYAITVTQEGAGPILQTVAPAVAKKCELMLQPAEWSAYGWVDGSIGSELNVAVTNTAGSRASCVINTLLVNAPQHIGSLITMTVRTLGNGKVLYVSKYNRELAQLENEQQLAAARSGAVSPTQSLANSSAQSGDRSNDLVLKLRLQSVGLSLVAESPVRRELFSAYVENLVSVMRRVPESSSENSKSTFDLKVKDIHIDNYTDTAVYPVLMNSINSDERLEAEKQRKRKSSDATSSSNSDKLTSTSSSDDLGETGQEYRPFLRFSMAWEQPRGQQAVVVKYLAVRMLELKVAVDTSTLYIYFLDLHKDLVQQPVFIDSADPRGLQLYLEDFNAKALDTQLHHVNAQDASPEAAFLSAQRHKYFFEALIIHPIKITLTFTPTSLSAKRNAEVLVAFGGNNPLRLLPRIAAVEDFAVKISSFIVDHALESQRSMRQRIITKTVLDLKAQMLHIAGNLVGSMTLLGKPAGLYKNIGGGVSDFFYEPFMGIMESPQAFILGLGKGTGSLIGGVATGVIGSAANLVGTATTGVSTLTESVANLSGDDKYMQRREEKLRAAKAGQGGVLSGLKSGGESMFSGVASGLSGLVTKPYQEGKKSGALGVVKGMGMGIIGVATKPVMGVSDGLSSIATGFSQQMQDPLKIVSHIRPARAFEMTEDKDDAPPALCKFDLFAAEAQQYVRRRAIIKTYNDEYLASCTLGFPKNSSRPADALFGVALSKQYIFLLSGTMHKDWKITWAELSHVALEIDATSGAVDFVSYAGSSWGGGERASALAAGKGDGQSRRIQCANRASAIKLYSTLTRFAYRMGNPAAVVPLEDHLTEDSCYSGQDSEASQAAQPQQGLTRRSSIGSATATSSYKFGTANKRENRCGTMSEAQIFASMRLDLEKLSLGMLQEQGGADRYHKLLDEATWQLICMWRSNHNMVFNPSRCAACLIVNNSPHYVQVMDFELKEGKDYVILGVGEGYDKDSRSLVAAGGAVIIFAFGYVPTLTDLAHVKLRLFTSAFSAVISTRRNRSDIANQSGFHAGYVEKVQADYWTKSVIVIN